METPTALGHIVVLNGVSRAGKSTVARAIQESVPGIWMHLGMDAHKACTPPSKQPGVGLRPGRHQVGAAVEDCVPILYAALYEAVAAHAMLGLNVVMDVNHHDSYSVPRGILQDCARRLAGLPVLFVGVRCPIDVIWVRREATWGQARGTVDAGVTAAVELAQWATHAHGCYDLEIDTSLLSLDECVEVIAKRLMEGPPGSAFSTIAAGGAIA
jgi:chloramphenicol 3-O phosphotransferase